MNSEPLIEIECPSQRLLRMAGIGCFAILLSLYLLWDSGWFAGTVQLPADFYSGIAVGVIGVALALASLDRLWLRPRPILVVKSDGVTFNALGSFRPTRVPFEEIASIAVFCHRTIKFIGITPLSADPAHFPHASRFRGAARWHRFLFGVPVAIAVPETLLDAKQFGEVVDLLADVVGCEIVNVA